MENREQTGVWGGTTEDERRSRWGQPSPAGDPSRASGRAAHAPSRLAISGCSRPSGGREGGDWADIFARTDGPGTVLTIGDAMGHGETAVWFQRQLRRAARGLLRACSADVTGVIGQPDRIASGRDALATYLVASMDLGARRLSVSRAGHPPPVIIDHSGRCTFAHLFRASVAVSPADDDVTVLVARLEPAAGSVGADETRISSVAAMGG